MPKIIDHSKMREEIAVKAISIFLEYGYKHLGMRQLCAELDMSKSALYHYFKNKDEIFKAATEALVSNDITIHTLEPLAESPSIEEKCAAFEQVFQIMSRRYYQETKLVFEYIDVIGQSAVPHDACMKLANQKYIAFIAKYVDSEQAETLYSALLGLLTQQVLCGDDFKVEQVKAMAYKLLS